MYIALTLAATLTMSWYWFFILVAAYLIFRHTEPVVIFLLVYLPSFWLMNQQL